MDTGENSMTGGRLKRVKEYLRDAKAFCFTYGDGLADVDLRSLIQYHHDHGKLATVTAVQPPGRYGALEKNSQGRVEKFLEKPKGDGGWINGGFFILSPKVLDWIAGDATSWEADTMVKLAAKGQIMGFEHRGFWQPMDTLRDKNHLEELWAAGKAPWKLWD